MLDGTEQAGEAATEVAAETKTRARKPMRPGECRTYMRKELAKEFEGIVKGFIDSAKSGSCPHVKLATEFLEPRPRAPRAKTGRKTLERWTDEMERGV